MNKIFIKTRKSMMFIVLILLILSNEGLSKIRTFVAQPVGPNAFGVSWSTIGQDSNNLYFRLYRKIGEKKYILIRTLEANRTDFVDLIDWKDMVYCKYKIEVIARNSSKIISTKETFTMPGSNLVANGDFEFKTSDNKIYGVSISAASTWDYEIIERKDKPKNSCLRFVISNPDKAPKINIYTPRFVVSPETNYLFSWWTTESINGCVGGGGQAYTYTSDMKTSVYSKVSSLYVYVSDRDNNWIHYFGDSDRIHSDNYFATVRLWSVGNYHPEAISFDDIMIKDLDIELLLDFDNFSFFSEAQRFTKKKSQDQLTSEFLEQAENQVSQIFRRLNGSAGISIQKYFEIRSVLCDKIRSLQEMLNFAKIEKLKSK